MPDVAAWLTAGSLVVIAATNVLRVWWYRPHPLEPLATLDTTEGR